MRTLSPEPTLPDRNCAPDLAKRIRWRFAPLGDVELDESLAEAHKQFADMTPEAIEAADRLKLSERDSLLVLDLLENPPPANNRLRAAGATHNPVHSGEILLLRCVACGWCHVAVPAGEPANTCCFRCSGTAFVATDVGDVPRGVTVQALTWPAADDAAS